MRRCGALLAAALCLAAAISTSAAGAASCPNEAFRVGPSALLPQCRAYELVSPAAKNGGNVSTTYGVRAAPGGEAVSFGSSASFAGSTGSALGSTYIGRRGSDWATEPVDPPQFNEGGLLLRGTPVSSRDLRYSLGASRLALTPGATEMGSNLYLRDNATGARTLLTTTPGKELFTLASGASSGVFLGASADWSHVMINSREPLPVPSSEPQPSLTAEENLYDLSGGEAHVINVLPDGTVSENGAHIGNSNKAYQHLISEDGSRAFFQTGSFGGGPLYVRENNTTTSPISMSQNGSEAGEMKEAELRVATPDGTFAFFTTPYELIEGAGPTSGYRYDVATHELTALVPNPPVGGPGVQEVLAVSNDGSYVYFSATAALAEGATEAPPSGVNFYVSHDGAIRFIGQTDTEDGEFAFPPSMQASPNGKFFGFTTASPMTEEDVPSPACPTEIGINNAPEHCYDVYLYDYEANKLNCVSCKGATNAQGEWEWLPGRGFSELGGQKTHEPGTGNEWPRAVLDDGSIYFDTPNALLTRDLNGVGDVYDWRDGSPELVSTGKGEQPSNFGDATPDGSNVFFLTKQQLVGTDTDESTDVYDDREGGGLAAQWPPGSELPCEGEECRGAFTTSPAGLPQGAAPAAGNAPAKSCTSVRTQAKKASTKARGLNKRAKRAGKHGSKAQAKRLRRQASAARKRADQIHKKAVTCGRNG